MASLNGSEAVIHDCYIDNAEEVDPATGEVIVPFEGPTPSEYRLVLDDGQWRIFASADREDLRGAMCG